MNNYEYYLGGSLPLNATTYVKRKADEDLYQGLKNGEFCYVLNSRQMGKSSLRVKTMQRLQQENVACVSIDMTEIGIYDITPSEWYASIIDTILTALNLEDDFDLEEFWEDNSQLSNIKRFSKFISQNLLPSICQQIVIFIDEIDSTLSLPFNIDDFFAVVRDCYNKRADNSDYQKLTFAMIGVATPADLIKDKKRTPFNIGRAIKLTGFQLAEVEPLAKGLVEKTANINKLMDAVLDWTGGQPFLTQKVCKLISNSAEIVPDGQEAEWVANLLRHRIIENWQVHDDPEHLKTIRDRLLVNEKRASRLLGLYQQVLNSGGVVADDSPDQMELRLTGLVIKQEGQLQVANRIYQEVFNLQWVEKELGKLRPYSEAFTAWEESGCKDESRLLRGQALADALVWAVDKSLSDRDYQFLATAQEVEKQAIELEKQAIELEKLEAQIKLEAQLKANQILEEAKQKVDLKLAEAEAVGKSITSKLLSNSGKHFEGLLQALRAVKQLPPPNEIFQPQDESKIQIIDALSQAIYIDEPYRERNRLEGHKDAVNSVAFSPDGEIIATASSDNMVKLWSRHGKLLQTLTGHQSSVFGVAFSPDGETIASASRDNTVKLWSRNRELLHTLIGHESWVIGVAFSPDGETIATASRDNTLKLWSRDGKLLQTLAGHQSSVWGVAFSPDGETIVSASFDNTVKLWSRYGKLLHTLTGHEGLVRGVAFSSDGETIFSASWDNTVKLWSRQGNLLHTLTGHESSVFGVAFSPDKEIIATASNDKTVKLWSGDGNLLHILTGHDGGVEDVAFSPDGETIASASFDNTVKLWFRQDNLLHTLTEHESWVRGIAFSPDGYTIASASYDKTVKLWSRDGNLLHTLTGHESWVEDVAFSPDGKTIATASDDNTVKLWSGDGKLLHTFTGHQRSVRSVAFSPDGKTIATASFDNTVKLWSYYGKLLHTLTGHEGRVYSVGFSPDGETIASASDDKTVKLWSGDGKLLGILTGHQGSVRGVAFSPDGKTIASGSWDNTVKLWSCHGKLLHTLTGNGGKVFGVAFSPDGETIASANFDHTVKLWNCHGKLLHTLTGHKGLVRSVAFSPDGETIVTASDDNTVKLWHGWKFDRLHQWGCNWMRDYLENNPNVSESDRHLCDCVGG
ncbi:MAG: hypothetical protein F6K23_35210 [Okeania sp. SIO2C9]|uniref:WD40 domain-containing protein n=1 Tax=Okeania sp. SIO2C9 TaxID=2607791 RepID=UPI0013C0634F|nr:AAA-like domain-containing protein [Okeania sp. SIO2C9]NEQ77808.1 hypothetical protein [Okeania sp. SIO2C9]